ncbi:MAG: radical SAM protein [bacterium]|nr:radical SAM protein [bacterium]
MDILLIFPPIREDDLPRNFPTGLGIIAQVLIDQGHNVRVLDINGNRWRREEVERRIKNASYDIAGIGGLITVYNYTKWLIPILKKRNPKAPVIIGGSVGSSIPELILKKTEADIVVIGEGEETIKELITTLEAGGDLKDVNGIWFRDDGRISKTAPREPIKDLDRIPFPCFDLFPMEVYLKNPVVGIGRDIDLITSRGCPHRCIYCYQIFGRTYRYHSVEYMIELIKLLKKRYRIDFVSFQEDCFVVNKERVYRFCEELLRQRLKIKWSCTGRVNLVTEDMLKKMKQAGCVSVSYGIESGSQEILDRMKKGVKVEQAYRAIRLTRKIGLRAPTSFMLGTPGETKETIQETIDFCKSLNLPLQSIMFTTPYPGTPLYEEIKENGLIKDEEGFIMGLGDALRFTINLTNFSDQELIHFQRSMVEEVMESYNKPNFLKEAFQGCRLYGPRLYLKGLIQSQGRAFKLHRKRHGFNE